MVLFLAKLSGPKDALPGITSIPVRRQLGVLLKRLAEHPKLKHLAPAVGVVNKLDAYTMAGVDASSLVEERDFDQCIGAFTMLSDTTTSTTTERCAKTHIHKKL